MILQEHLPLWNKIQSFSIDDGTAEIPFSVKLAGLQSWSPAFTQAAIEEYKKFLLLCCISDKGASPSQTVDEVWHLHLTYTQSYWSELCRHVLGRDLHHHPSAGGNAEDHRHQEWYKETLQLYRTVFGYDARSDIWPAPEEAPWSYPAEAVDEKKGLLAVAVVAVMLAPFVLCWMMYGNIVPFFLTGTEFLVFFPIYSVAVILAYCFCRWRTKAAVEAIAARYFPADVTSFQVADFLFHRHRSLQLGIVDLCRRGLMEITKDELFIIKSASYRPVAGEKNPLMPILAEAPDREVRNYQQLLDGWYARANFSHPALVTLREWAQEKERFSGVKYFFVAFYGMAALRILQGLVNGRPILYLLLEMVAFGFLFYFVEKALRKWNFVSRKIRMLYEQRAQVFVNQDDEMLQRFTLQGPPAIAGFAEGILLTGIFSAYAPSALDGTMFDSSSSGWSSDGSGSSCGGGGGSSCGGGGCGGCGGGGGD